MKKKDLKELITGCTLGIGFWLAVCSLTLSWGLLK